MADFLSASTSTKQKRTHVKSLTRHYNEILIYILGYTNMPEVTYDSASRPQASAAASVPYHAGIGALFLCITHHHDSSSHHSSLITHAVTLLTHSLTHSLVIFTGSYSWAGWDIITSHSSHNISLDYSMCVLQRGQ